MNNKKQKRRRGIILTREGWQKIQNAKLEWELQDNKGYKFTLEELGDRASLTTATLRKILTRDRGVDKRSIVTLFTAFNLELNPNDYTSPKSPKEIDNNQDTLKRVDWGEAVDVSNFYGRKAELATLNKWLIEDGCRLITIAGMGGIGKTALSVKLAERVKDEYDYLIWRSLRDAPPIQDILVNLIQFLCDEQTVKAELPESVNGKISLLVECLRSSRCLIILDNLESLLCARSRAGICEEEYEEYDQLFQRVGELEHQSCLILTTREKPQQVAIFEGEASPVRSLLLNGFNEKEGEEILKIKGVSGSEPELAKLIAYYGGNALALKIVGTTIRDLFQGNITEFLRQDTVIFGDVQDLLDQQFNRLIDIEEKIIYWLAINREPMTLAQIQEDLVCSVSQSNLLEGLESLSRRCLIDRTEKSAIEQKDNCCFTLQSVVMEYVTSRLIENVYQEIVVRDFKLFRWHALIKATAKDYIKNTQIRLILQPVINNLLTILKGKRNLENRLKQIILTLQELSPHEPGYTAGNIINMFCQMETDLTGYDFSSLCVWQADLCQACLHDVNFQNADLAKSVFVETFGGVTSVAFSPDGKILAAGDTKGEIRLYRVADGKQILICQGHKNWIPSLAFSPDGSILASSSNDTTVKLWDIETGQCLKTLLGHNDEVWSIDFSLDGKLLASGSDDSTIKLWDINRGECFKTFQGHSHDVLAVVFSRDEQILASGSADNTIKLWDINRGECFKTLSGHNAALRAVIFSPDGQILASGSEDQTIKLWDVNSGKCLKTLQGHSNGVYSITFNPENDLLASSSEDQTIKLWDVNSGKCLKTLQGHSNWIYSVNFSPQGDFLASGSHDQTLRLWSVSTGQCLKIFQGYTNQILSIAYSRDGQTLASGGHDQNVRLWDINTGQTIKTFPGHQAAVRSVAFSPNGKMLASGSRDQKVRLWDVNTEQILKTFQGHQAAIWSIAFSPDGQTLASGSEDQTIELWDINTGQILKTFQGHQAAIWSIAFSPNGKMLASGALEPIVKLWDVSTGECIRTSEGHEIWAWSVAFSPDGHRLASTSIDGTLKLWSVSTGECLRTLQADTAWFQSIAFSPNGRTIASSSQDYTIKLWDVSTGECLNTLRGHTGWVWSVTFCPDGQTLASGSEDETIRIWDVKTGKRLKTLRAKKPYDGINLTGVTGITEATIGTLKVLGASNS
ncbi:MAG: NB-ARC domain-containing protein [Pleurocapsa sp. MO_226.B13]|nr:NB-ARC domain-containing protein [Pleurocapsa sp. MO_226.B13]